MRKARSGIGIHTDGPVPRRLWDTVGSGCIRARLPRPRRPKLGPHHRWISGEIIRDLVFECVESRSHYRARTSCRILADVEFADRHAAMLVLARCSFSTLRLVNSPHEPAC